MCIGEDVKTLAPYLSLSLPFGLGACSFRFVMVFGLDGDIDTRNVKLGLALETVEMENKDVNQRTSLELDSWIWKRVCWQETMSLPTGLEPSSIAYTTGEALGFKRGAFGTRKSKSPTLSVYLTAGQHSPGRQCASSALLRADMSAFRFALARMQLPNRSSWRCAGDSPMTQKLQNGKARQRRHIARLSSNADDASN